jgi:hypothetical protein
MLESVLESETFYVKTLARSLFPIVKWEKYEALHFETKTPNHYPKT